jgi:hypothetical protein
MAKLTDVLASTNNRVTALENNNLDATAGIARVSKLYGNTRVTATVSVKVTWFATANDDLYMADDDVWCNEINFL